MGDTAIIAFNNLELIFLLIGLTIRSNIYELVLSPMAMSFVTLLIVFKIVMFVIESAELKMQNSDLISGQFYLKLLFFICIARLLLRKTDLHIKTIKSVVNEETLDRNEKVNTFVPKDTEYTLESTGLFSFGKTGVEMFGDSWFSINQPHSEVLEGTPLMDSKFTDGGVYTVKLPIFVVFPIVLVDGLLYGSDGTPNSGSLGVIPRVFDKYYAYLIHDPGRVFHLVYDNSKFRVESQQGDMYGGYTAYRSSMMDAIHFINKSTEDIIQIYNNFPLYMYLDIRTGEKDRVKKDWRYNETSTQMKNIFSILNGYNKSLKDNLMGSIGTNSSAYLSSFSTFVDSYRGSSKAIPPVYPSDDYDISDNKAEDRYPTWKNTRGDNLLSSEYYMAGKITILQIENPVNNISDEEKFISELRNAYTSITKQNIPLNKRDNPYDDVVLNRGFYKKSDVNSLGMSGNYYDDYTLMFNLYEDFASKIGSGGALVSKNPFDMLVKDFQNMEKNIYVPNTNTLLAIPSFASDAMQTQKTEARKYNPNGSSIEKSTKLKKYYLEYQKNAYFKYYFIEPINFNRGQYYTNLDNSFSSKAPSLYYLWKAYQNFYNDISATFPKTQTINSMPIYKKLTDPVSSGGGGMIESKPQKYIMKVQEQSAIKNDSIIEEFRTKHYANTRTIAEKMINLKINNLWATKTKNLGQDEIRQDKSDMSSEAFGPKRDLKLDLPIVGEIGGTILKFILDLFGVIFYWVLKGVFLLLTHLFRILYSLVYSLHSLGLLITLVTFPLIFIKAMMSQSFAGLVKPFLNYLSYRMWDFALLLVIMIVLMVTPVILKFFFAFPSFLAVILEILYIIGIFMLTSTFIDMITKIIGGEGAFSGMFNTVGSGVGKTVATRGIATAATASGTAALMASRGVASFGRGGAGSNAVSNFPSSIGNSKVGKMTSRGIDNVKGSSIGQGIGNFGSTIGNSSFVQGAGNLGSSMGNKVSDMYNDAKSSDTAKFLGKAVKGSGMASSVGSTIGSRKDATMNRVRDYSRFQNNGGVAGTLLNKGEPLKQFDNSAEKTVKEGIKNFIKGDPSSKSSSKTLSEEDLTVGGNKTSRTGDKTSGTNNKINKRRSSNSNEFEASSEVSGANFASTIGNNNGTKTMGTNPIVEKVKEPTFAKNSSFVTPDKVQVDDIKRTGTNANVNGNARVSGLKRVSNDFNNANKINDNNKQNEAENNKKEERPNNFATQRQNVKKALEADARKMVDGLTNSNVGTSNVGDSTKSNKDNKSENGATTEKLTKERLERTVKETMSGMKPQGTSPENTKRIEEAMSKLSNSLTNALNGMNINGKSSGEIQKMLEKNTEVQKVFKETTKTEGLKDINLNTVVTNLTSNLNSTNK